MSGKSIVMIAVAALFGSLASAAVMRYVPPIGHMVMTAPTGIEFLDEPAGVKPGAVLDTAETSAARPQPDGDEGHGHAKSGEPTNRDPKSEAVHQADGHQDHEDHKDDADQGHDQKRHDHQ